jgi:hypothetical protein
MRCRPPARCTAVPAQHDRGTRRTPRCSRTISSTTTVAPRHSGERLIPAAIVCTTMTDAEKSPAEESPAITELTIGCLADDEVAAALRRAVLDLLESDEFTDVPWTLTVSRAPELRDSYSHLYDQAAVESGSGTAS